MHKRVCGAWKCAVLALSLASFNLFGQVVINEVMADNNGSVRNGPDYPKSYVELFNPTLSAVSLDGWYLTNNTNLLERFKYAFPPGAVIQPLSYLTVWCSKTTNGPGLYSGFDLKKSTDEVGLYQGPTNAAVLRDYVKFGFQISDLTISRYPDGSGAWQLAEASPTADNFAPIPLGTPSALKFNEWLANSGTIDDWFEIYNPATNPPVNMAGLFIYDAGGVATGKLLPPLSFINSNGFQLFWCTGNNSSTANECNFRLSENGDALVLLPYSGAPINLAIHRILIGAGQVEYMSEGYLPDGFTNNLVRFVVNKFTPGENNFQTITNVIVNEVLAHTDPPLMDAIEFLNHTTNEVRLDYYYLSNSEDNPRKYQFPTNTVIPPLGFLVVYERTFNPDGTGTSPSFTLNSANGDQVVLCSATNQGGPLTGFRLTKKFDATANGVSLGQHIKSDLKTDFVPMSRLSFGSPNPPASLDDFMTGRGETNPYPLVGPIIISEIMYHPPDIVSGTNLLDDSLNEYIEISNVASTNVPLFTPTENTNRWSIRGGVDYTFETLVVLPAKGSLLVVNFDPITNLTQLAAFKTKYNIPADFTRIYGPYKGKLANNSTLIELKRPDFAQQPPHPDAGYVPQLQVEKVRYDDLPPWPTNSVDGGGNSLHRFASLYANDETSWYGAPPSPGVFSAVTAPVISQQPQSLSVLQGGATNFTVAASGAPPLQFLWQFNNQGLAGQTNASLALTNVQPAQAGSYRVVVSNTGGSATSQVATLTVISGPYLAPPTMSTNGSFQLVFSATPGYVYDVQGSLNLSNWTTLATYTNSGSQITFTYPMTNAWMFLRTLVRP